MMDAPILLPVSSPMIPAWVRERLSSMLPGHWKVLVWNRFPCGPLKGSSAFAVAPPHTRLEYTEADFRAFYQLGGA